jgi:uncharacterized protein YndB with AHSA1/START domain
MKLISKQDYQASAGEIWQIIRDPGHMPAWNSKCISCSSTGDGGEGSVFEAVFEMKGKRSDTRGTVVDYQENASIAFRYEYEGEEKLGTVVESYQIRERKDGQVELTQTVDFAQSSLPYWVKLLIGFLGRFGRKRGRGPLDGIQDILGS